MLTFTFTGVDGVMSEVETLTSGMVGKQIRLSFDDSWKNLTKTAVFCAGNMTRVVVDPEDIVTIPSDVLARPFFNLFVGVYGTNAEGTVVIPTILVEGPMIRYGADPIEDETAKELPVWQNMQNQIGNLPLLETEATGNLVAAINELSHQITELSQILGVNDSLQDSNLLLHWDFRTASTDDLVAGVSLHATNNITFDETGAHTTSSTSYLTFPLHPEGKSLAGNVLEIQFGAMEINDTGSTIRLATGNAGTQPAGNGIFWSTSDCWTHMLTNVTEFNDLQMFSGKRLFAYPTEDALGMQWYCEDQYICTSTTSVPPLYGSIGCSAGAAHPVTVEYIKIYPAE